MRLEHGVAHLYVHVPFCPTVCPFCSFEVAERAPGLVEAWLDRLDAEAAAAVDAVEMAPLRTVYLGGGTPSYLRAREFERMVGIVRRRFGWAPEVTLEVHPSTVSADRVALWVEAGVTRLSLGVESFDDRVLSWLGRPYDGSSAREALATVLTVAGGRALVSVDVMTAAPGQDVRADLLAAAANGVDHVSAYVVTVEEGTPFHRDGVEIDEERAAEAFGAAEEVLSAAGYSRYEVSNHARPGASCAHNLAYWDNGWWLGLGPGASSHLPSDLADAVAVRTRAASLHRWLAGDPAGREVRTAGGYVDDAVLAGLRRTAGVDLAEVGERVELDAWTPRAAAVGQLVEDGLLWRVGRRIGAAPAGVARLDGVTARLMVEPAPEGG